MAASATTPTSRPRSASKENNLVNAPTSRSRRSELASRGFSRVEVSSGTQRVVNPIRSFVTRETLFTSAPPPKWTPMFLDEVLLPTCRVVVILDGVRFETRVMLDQCPTYSRIHAALVVKIRGRPFPPSAPPQIRISVVSKHDDSMRISMGVEVHPQVAIVTPTRDLPDDLRNGFHNMLLADPGFYRKSPVRLILGANVYEHIISPSLVSMDFPWPKALSLDG